MAKKIKGGYVLVAKRIEDSKIAHAAPHVREVWHYLIRKAEPFDKVVDDVEIKRGQLATSYKAIIEDLRWMAGARTCRYAKEQIHRAFKVLRGNQMVTTAKTTRGITVTVCNYSTYQDKRNYGNHTESDAGAQSNATVEGDEKTAVEFTDDVEKMFDFFCNERGVNPKSETIGIDWRHAIRKTIDLDKRDKHEMGLLIRWVSQDIEDARPGSTWTGWRAQIRSPVKFRAKYEQLLEKMQIKNRSQGAPSTPLKPFVALTREQNAAEERRLAEALGGDAKGAM